MTSEGIAGRAGGPQNRAIPTPSREPALEIALLVLALAAVGAPSARAVADHGFVGIFAHGLQNTAGTEVLADLVIALVLALVLVMAWMVGDARRLGRTASLAAGAL